MKKNKSSKSSKSVKSGKLIITHSANFHPDDVCAVATLVYMYEAKGYSQKSKDPAKRIKIIRTLEPETYESVADHIVDIGGKYDPKKGWLDHHQIGGAGERKNGVKYASFGLVWKEFGKKLTGSQFAADWVDRHMVQGIDAMDTGMYLYNPIFDDVYPFLFDEYIGTVCDTVKGGTSRPSERLKNFDKEFMRVMPIAKDALRVFIIKSKQKEKIAKLARNAYAKAKDKRVIVSDTFIPTRFDQFKAPEFVEPLVFVYPDLRGGWSAKVMSIGGQTYETRMKFPEKWRGRRDADMAEVSGVPDAIFCHNSGFLAVAKSKDGALKLVRQAFRIMGLDKFEL
jgi:uncharacterized UPF0160 family protein